MRDIKKLQAMAEKGNAVAQVKLGAYYYKKVDIEKTVYWFFKAAEQGNKKAQDFIECWSIKGAEQGNAESRFNLGICYYKGKILPKDLEKAKYWLSLAAMRGKDEAQKILEEIKK